MKVEVKRKNKRGKMVFEFREVVDSIPCSNCPGSYGICTELPDPRFRDWKKHSFIDFCQYEGKDKFAPSPKSLERYYGRKIEKIKLGIKT